MNNKFSFRMLERKIRQCLSGAPYADNVFSKQTFQAKIGSYLVAAFYYASLIFFFYSFSHFQLVRRMQGLDLLPWLKPLSFLPNSFLIDFAILSTALSLLLNLFFWRKRWARILFFSSLLVLDGITNSFGKINHVYTIWVYVAFIFSWIPSLPKIHLQTRLQKQTLLSYISLAQGSLLVTYSLSGIWKLRSAWDQFTRQEVHAFLPEALPRVIAAKLTQINSTTPLGDWLIQHMGVSHILHIGGIILQTSALLIIFRPKLHRFYGLSFALFHIATYYIMLINFPIQASLAALLLIGSPFAFREKGGSTILI